MIRVLLLFILFHSCFSADWTDDSYLNAYSKSEETATLYGAYQNYPIMTMKNESVVSMIPFIFQLVLLIAKIVLKLTIFKIIVKFIAVVCLFLFIPTLRMPKARSTGISSRKSNMLNMKLHEAANSIDPLTELFKEAITKYKDVLT